MQPLNLYFGLTFYFYRHKFHWFKLLSTYATEICNSLVVIHLIESQDRITDKREIPLKAQQP